MRLRPLPWRSLQVRLHGGAVHRYLDEWITGIDDVTELAHAVHARVREGSVERAAALLPAERPYPLPPGVASRIEATPGPAESPGVGAGGSVA